MYECRQHDLKRSSILKISYHIVFSFSPSPSRKTQDLKMESSGNHGGIQQLLAAEQEAQQIVNAARTAKMARLKQAKDEAETEIADHKTTTEHSFQRKLEETSGDSGANVKRLEQETDEKIEQLKNEASRISRDVVDMLLKHVTTVNN
ncbi:hypothetical protein IGI04_013096 [Brassica rapa subsp. trilocularis]|nr:V-type proton ATPase subunit G2 [Brassica rapa]KAG5406977.1 hypothetical protein IGI04_013096 [Brassica rapa subsp. trilocularis]